jgi:broad specificity phosphatase PhoE
LLKLLKNFKKLSERKLSSMSMPNNLVLIRHGQSEANLMQKASKEGDSSFYTEENMLYTDSSWRLTELGVLQAEAAGRWISENIGNHFDRYVTSPFIRTRETAAHLNLPNARWQENRIIRERSWGEINAMSRQKFAEDYPFNEIFKNKDPLYWKPPAGESIADVAENRVTNLLSSLHRENSGQNVLLVSHGEFIRAVRLVLERWSDEDFFDFEFDEDYKIHNCMIFHYTRVDPETGEVSSKIRWLKTAYPRMTESGSMEMVESDWLNFDKRYLSNKQLLELAEAQKRRLS